MTGHSKTSLRSLPIVVVAGFVHVLLLSGPMFLVRDVPSAIGDPRLLLFLLLASVWFFLESVASQNEPQRPTGTSGRPWLELEIGVATLVTFWICLLDAPPAGLGDLGLAAAFGAILMATGAVLRWLSIRTLGRFFLNDVAVVPGQPLVTHGVYSVVRHPSEVGTLCLALGAVTLWESTLGLVACFVLLLPGVMRRTRLEDEVLRRHHPVAFVRYAHDVGALFPRPGQVRRIIGTAIDQEVRRAH